jgi:hypothetical protein
VDGAHIASPVEDVPLREMLMGRRLELQFEYIQKNARPAATSTYKAGKDHLRGPALPLN